MTWKSADEFDGWLEQQLGAAAGGSGSSAPLAGRYDATNPGGGTHMSLFRKTVAVVTAQGALGLVVGVLAVSAAGMAGGLTLTGNINPTNWGQQVVQQVDKCKDTLRASGERGIGHCVSAFAKTHASGARENLPTNSPSTDNGNGKSKGNPNSRGLGNGHAANNPGKGHNK